MNLQKLKLYNFRNFNKLELDLSSDINIITGLNGSGKTSILEAVYLLATGRSFRTSNTAKLINFGSEFFAVYSEFCSSLDKNTEVITSIGYQKSKNDGNQIKLDNKNINSISEIARILPVNCLEGSFFRALSGDAQFRRKIFDWGVFHVKHSFFSAWRKYHEILQQRNMLLKTRVGISSIQSWNNLFAEAAIVMASLRAEYIKEMLPYFDEYIKSFSRVPHNISITLNHGLSTMNKGEVIAKLEENFTKDIERGFTSFGPHRADLVFRCEGGTARDILSRGQQKIALISFFLAQLKYLRYSQGKCCIVLLDDLASELDNDVLDILYQHLQALEHQLLITAISQNDFPEYIKASNTISL